MQGEYWRVSDGWLYKGQRLVTLKRWMKGESQSLNLKGKIKSESKRVNER